MTQRPIDVVGDIHGMHGRLRGLLSALGFERRHGRWTHDAGHRLVFVGDYVDRGRMPMEAVAMVRDLCADGMALALLGNHDSNAIAFCMRAGRAVLDAQSAWHDGRSELIAVEGSRRWLRLHHDHEGEAGFRNVHQHAATLCGFKDPAAYERAIRWVMTLPAWLELPGLRVVHAAWIPKALACLDGWAARRGIRSVGVRASGFDEALEIQRVREASPPGDDAWHELLDLRDVPHAHQVVADHSPAVALDRILKVVEIRLPEDVALDGLGRHGRSEIRMRWFEAAGGKSFADVAPMNRHDVLKLASVTQGFTVDEARPGYCGIGALV